MLYQGIIALCLSILMVNLILNLRALHKLGDEKGQLPEPPPLISILVPARDEESDIGTCLGSLRRQDYPNFEILVLDDSSSDNTAAVVEQIAAVDPRVRLLRGKPLLRGWAGKPFACHQLAQQAQGTWLLFTDADTQHAPHMLSQVLATAVRSNAALVSGFPYQRTTSIWQKIMLPILLYFALIALMPLWWLQRSRRALASVAIGQFLFFSAREYRSIGGHEAVKSRVLEDVWLGIEMARHGYRQLTLDLSRLVCCHMYRDLGTMWDGIARWLYMVASVSVILFVGLIALVSLLLLAPFLFLLYGLFIAQPAFGWQMLVAIQVGILFLARFLVGRRFSQPTISALLHPLGMIFLLLMAVYATYRYLLRSGVKWKGRVYEQDGLVK